MEYTEWIAVPVSTGYNIRGYAFQKESGKRKIHFDKSRYIAQFIPTSRTAALMAKGERSFQLLLHIEEELMYLIRKRNTEDAERINDLISKIRTLKDRVHEFAMEF